jgi:2-methylisocitrate lyase-like PEP mutase family enzyme
MPLLAVDELDVLGYDVVIFSGVGFFLMLQTFDKVYPEVVEAGSIEPVIDQLQSWDLWHDVTRLDEIAELEEKYGIDR